MPEIYSKINAIMNEIPAIGKDKQNKQQGFAYRGIDDVMNALFPLLAKHGVFVVPEVLSTNRTERVTRNGGNMAFTVSTVRYTFYATDGSSVSAVTTGEGMDSADKSTNKAMAAAMKYAFFQTFCIPTEEAANDDPDKETPEESGPVLDYTPVDRPKKSTPAPEKTPAEQPEKWICADCSCVIQDVVKKDGSVMSAMEVAAQTYNKYKRMLCFSCWADEKTRIKASGAAS